MDQRLLLLLTCLLLIAIPSTHTAALVDHQLGPDQVHGDVVQESKRHLRRVKRQDCGRTFGACSGFFFINLCTCDQFPFGLQSQECHCFCEKIRWMRNCGFGYDWLDYHYPNELRL